MTTWVVQRIVDGWFFNGFRTESWSKYVVAARAYASKEAAVEDMADRGWRGVVYSALPEVQSLEPEPDRVLHS